MEFDVLGGRDDGEYNSFGLVRISIIFLMYDDFVNGAESFARRIWPWPTYVLLRKLSQSYHCRWKLTPRHSANTELPRNWCHRFQHTKRQSNELTCHVLAPVRTKLAHSNMVFILQLVCTVYSTKKDNVLKQAKFWANTMQARWNYALMVVPGILTIMVLLLWQYCGYWWNETIFFNTPG